MLDLAMTPASGMQIPAVCLEHSSLGLVFAKHLDAADLTLIDEQGLGVYRITGVWLNRFRCPRCGKFFLMATTTRRFMLSVRRIGANAATQPLPTWLVKRIYPPRSDSRLMWVPRRCSRAVLDIFGAHSPGERAREVDVLSKTGPTYSDVIAAGRFMFSGP